MDEKILIQSKHYSIKIITIVLSVIAIALCVYTLASTVTNRYSYYEDKYYDEEWKPRFLCHCTVGEKIGTNKYGYGIYSDPLVDSKEEFYEQHPTVSSFIKCCGENLIHEDELIDACIPLCLIVFAVILHFWFSSYQLIVTDKRVYGKAAFGKRIDLPLDSISAVGTSFLKGIDVGTSSGRIKFKLVKNQKDVHSTMSNLLMERQHKSNQNTTSENTVSVSNVDELKKFKELLDSEIITQEEFDAKKKQLLGL